MKNKLSLRSYIFLAFLAVFLVSFSIVFVSFNWLVNDYFDKQIKDKLSKAITLAGNVSKIPTASEILGTEKDTFYDPATVLEQIIQAIQDGTDVRLAVSNLDYTTKFPKVSSDPQGYREASTILLYLKNNGYKLTADLQYYHIKTKEGRSYWFTTIPVTIQSKHQYHMLLYMDRSEYDLFIYGVNQILVIVLLVTLILALLASLMVSNNIIKSIKRLIDLATQIGSGIFVKDKLKLRAKELDILADNMIAMSVKLDQAEKDQQLFFQNASHELRTPLMSIQGYAEGIKYKVFDNTEEASDIIISESQRLTTMVENLLTISRIDTAAANQAEVIREEIDIQELLLSVMEKIKGAAIIKDKKINFLPSANPGEIYFILGNENDLFRAFENILANGLRYTKKNIDILLSTDPEEKNITVTIMDDGEGINPKYLDHIFDRFYRGEKGKHGIGLAIVKAIIKQNRGQVTAGNRQGEDETGAVFLVTLPLDHIKKPQNETIIPQR